MFLEWEQGGNQETGEANQSLQNNFGAHLLMGCGTKVSPEIVKIA